MLSPLEELFPSRGDELYRSTSLLPSLSLSLSEMEKNKWIQWFWNLVFYYTSERDIAKRYLCEDNGVISGTDLQSDFGGKDMNV